MKFVRSEDKQKSYLKIYNNVLDLVPGFRDKVKTDRYKDSFKSLLDTVGLYMRIYTRIHSHVFTIDDQE